MNPEKKTTVIAGASGFVGQKLVEHLSQQQNVIALSRSVGPDKKAQENKQLSWRTCDLFSLKQAEQALEGANTGVYLVHSMLPTSALTQSTFQDLDLLVADNFGRAAAKCGLEKIIYVGGIIPDGMRLSRHLESRLEVETALRSYGVPVITLRAGMIVGAKGSSFNIMLKLVERLPMMICPQWTSTPNQPIHVDDMVAALTYSINKIENKNQTFDVAGPDIKSYLDLMKVTANTLGVKRIFFPIPIFSPQLSRLWVQLVTGAPFQLMAPLIDSLKHPMVATPKRQLLIPGHSFLSLKEAIEIEIKKIKTEKNKIKPYAFQGNAPKRSKREVRSIQRLPLPRHKTASWAANTYMNWLAKLMPFIIRVEEKEHVFNLCFPFMPRKPLLTLELSQDRSSSDRPLFYIRGGILNKLNDNGRLEFREVLGGNALIAGIHEYSPSLPWFIYKWTQAKLHLIIMFLFGRFLSKIDQS